MWPKSKINQFFFLRSKIYFKYVNKEYKILIQTNFTAGKDEAPEMQEAEATGGSKGQAVRHLLTPIFPWSTFIG